MTGKPFAKGQLVRLVSCHHMHNRAVKDAVGTVLEVRSATGRRPGCWLMFDKLRWIAGRFLEAVPESGRV